MITYSWVGYTDFTETDPYTLIGRIEVFNQSSGFPFEEYVLRFKQVFLNTVDFRDWIDDFTTEEILSLEKIISLFKQEHPSANFQTLVV